MANFNVDEFLQSQGLSITGVNPDTGKVSVKNIDPNTGNEKVGSFDPRTFLKARGMNPDEVNVIINRPTTAIEETGLGFLQQMDILFARTPGEQFQFLQKEFGPNNVQRMEDGKLVVKDSDGVWKSAESGFLAGLAKESPTIGFGIAGTIKGATLGLALPIPGGAFVGAIIGGGVGAAMGKITDIAAAEAAGIRTESDADDALSEVGKEFVDAITWGVAFGAAGKTLKLAKQGLKSTFLPLTQAMEDWAQTAAQLTGVNARTYRTLFDPDLSKRVLAMRNRMVRWVRGGEQGIDPNTTQQINIVQKTMQQAKVNSSAQFDKFQNALDKEGLLQNTKVDLGVMRTKVDELRKTLFDPDGPIAPIVDPRSLNKLKKTFDTIIQAGRGKQQKSIETRIGTLQQAIRGTSNKQVISRSKDRIKELQELRLTTSFSISLKQARTLRSNLDEMLESSGFYKQGEFSVTKPGRRIMKQLRDDLSNSMGNSLKGKTVRIDGQQKDAVKIWNEMNKDYHEFRNIFDEFALPKRLDSNRAAQTVERMLGEKGGALEEQFSALSKLAGDTRNITMNQMRVLQAGKNLGHIYGKGNPGFGGLPRTILAPTGLTSPKLAERQIRMSKVSAISINALNKMGKAVDFLTSQKPNTFNQIITNSQLFRGIFGAATQAVQQETALTNQLLGQ